jgi:hypothetical protein
MHHGQGVPGAEAMLGIDMNRYLDGPRVPFQTAADRKALVGKTIRYLRPCDIDRSGRGYFFPRVATVVEAKGVQLIFENGDSVARGDLAEVEVIG